MKSQETRSFFIAGCMVLAFLMLCGCSGQSGRGQDASGQSGRGQDASGQSDRGQGDGPGGENSAVTIPGEEWERVSVAEAGFPEDFAAQINTVVEKDDVPITSLILVQDGRMVFEGYWNGLAQGEMTALYSATKSINSLLAGIAIDRGLLPDEDVLISEYLPGYEAAFDGDTARAAISLKNLLQMRSGIAYDEWKLDYTDSSNPYQQWLKTTDRIAWILDLPMAEAPGKTFRYQTPASQLVPRVIEQAADTDLVSFAHEHLFGLLGITPERVIWRLDDAGHARVGACNMVPADLARIGLLVLRGGRWGDSQVVSGGWIERSLISAGKMKYGVGFGYHWWIREVSGAQKNGHQSTTGTIPVFGAEGYGGQCLFVVPDAKLVCVVTGEFDGGPDEAFRFVKDQVLSVLNHRG